MATTAAEWQAYRTRGQTGCARRPAPDRLAACLSALCWQCSSTALQEHSSGWQVAVHGAFHQTGSIGDCCESVSAFGQVVIVRGVPKPLAMGFVQQGKQCGSSSGHMCTKKMVNIFSSLSTLNTLGNSSLFSHLRSLQRSKRIKSCNSAELVEQLNPINNLCYQSMLPNRYDAKNNNYYNASCKESSKNSTPVVSFRNKGEGMIAMQLVNRVMINENQLYSMNISPQSKLANNDFRLGTVHLQKSLADVNCYESLEPPYQIDKLSPDDPLRHETWYYGGISREQAIEVVHNCPTGSFVVRKSSTKESCYALTVRVPHDYNHLGVAHYLILQTNETKYKIKGFHKEFSTISSLITHHSIMKEQLPCTLRLNPSNNFYKSVSCSQLGISTHKSTSPIYLMDSTVNKQSQNHIYNTYLSNINCHKEDLMVDVDTDPTYHKVLDTFRRAMAHCS